MGREKEREKGGRRVREQRKGALGCMEREREKDRRREIKRQRDR